MTTNTDATLSCGPCVKHAQRAAEELQDILDAHGHSLSPGLLDVVAKARAAAQRAVDALREGESPT